MKHSPFIFAKIFAILSVVLAASTPRQFAAPLYFDTVNGNGSLNGGSASWSAAAAIWNTASDGSATPLVGWTPGSDAVFQTGAVNNLTLTENLSVNSLLQTLPGTQTTIGVAATGPVLTLTGNADAVSNNSGSPLTFGLNLDLLLAPIDNLVAQTWNAAANSDIIVNGRLTGVAGTAATGGLNKTGAGMLVLAGANTYSGYTRLSEGILRADSATAFGTSSIIFAGGTLQYGSGITTDFSGKFAQASNTAAYIIDTNGNNVTFATALSGNKGLVKKGAGILNMAAGSTYSGGTTIEAGTLRNGGGAETNPFGATGSIITVKDGATLDLNWTGTSSAHTYRTAQYVLHIEGKGAADTSGTVFGGYVGALTNSGSYNSTEQAFSHMLLTGDTTISGKYATGGQRYGVPASIDARKRDAFGNPIEGSYHTLTIVNGNAISWRGSNAAQVQVGDIVIEQGRLWSDGGEFGDNNFSIIVNANPLGDGTVFGEFGNWYSDRTINKKITVNGGLVIFEGYSNSSSGRYVYGATTRYTLAGQITLASNPLMANRFQSLYSLRDFNVTGKVTGTGGFTLLGSVAELNGWTDSSYTNSITINRYSVFSLLNSTNDFTGPIRIDSGVLRLSNGTLHGTLGAASNEVNFSNAASIGILDLFGTNQNIGALNGTGTNQFVQNNRQNLTSMLTIGNGNANGAFSGVLRDYAALPADNIAISGEGSNNARLALTKTGSGRQILSGINTFTGGVSIYQGQLQIGSGATGHSTATLGNSAFTVYGGTLLGNGTIGTAGLTSTVNSGGTLSIGTFDQTAQQHLSSAGSLSINGALAFDLWNATSGSGSTSYSDYLNFLNPASFSLNGTGALMVTDKTSSSNTWTTGTWFQLFDWSNVASEDRSIDLSNAASWLLPTLNTSLYQWDLTRLTQDGRIYVVDILAAATLELDPLKSINGAIDWNSSVGNLAWDDPDTAGVTLQTWTPAVKAVINNGASNTLNLTEDITALSITQSNAGTSSSINSSAGRTLKLTDPNRAVTNTSGAALTFGNGMTIDLTGSGDKEWFADATSPITVNSVITGATGSYSAGTATGGLIKIGQGLLTLNGENTYSGVTQLRQGTLAAGHANAFGTSTIVFNGGTLRYDLDVAGGFASQIAPLNFGASARLDTNGRNITLDTPLSGSGGITKLGNGTLTTAPGNTFTGTTEVFAGTLQNGATAATQNGGFGANNSRIIVHNGAAIDVNWGHADNYTTTKYDLYVEGKGLADSTGSIAGGYIGAITQSGALSATANPFANITLTGATTISGKTGAATGRWGITKIDANFHDLTIVNANGLSWNVGNIANAINVRDIYIEQGHVFADGTFFGDDNYSIILNASRTANNSLARGELRKYNSGGTITKKITINGGAIGLSGDAGGANSVPKTLIFSGQVTLNANPLATNRLYTDRPHRDLKFTGKITGSGGFDWQGGIGTFDYYQGANDPVLTGTPRLGTLTITNSDNDFTGPINLISGLLRLSDGTNDGSLGTGNNVTFTTSANQTVLDLFGTSQIIGALNGTSTTNFFIQNNRANTTSILSVGTGNTSGDFAGILRDYGILPAANASSAEATYTGDGATGAALSFRKVGTGTQTLRGASTYTGDTIVDEGTLLVRNTPATGTSGTGLGNFTANGTSTVGGTGSITGADSKDITLSAGTFLMVGNTRKVNAAGGGVASELLLGSATTVDLFLNGTVQIDIFANSVDTPTTEADRLKLVSNGATTISGTLEVFDTTGTSATWTAGNTWQVIDWTGVTNRTGTFANLILPELNSLYSWNTNALYTTGTISVINAIPEPSRALLLLLALLGLTSRRRRR
jgi:fibronectin-binding autotransporter adhesin